jgi:hypothetical protein
VARFSGMGGLTVIGGGLTTLGLLGGNFGFAGFSSMRTIQVKSWFVLVLFARNSWLVFLTGYRSLDRLQEQV